MDTYFFGIFVNNLCTTLINNKNKGCTLLLKSERKLFHFSGVPRKSDKCYYEDLF